MFINETNFDEKAGELFTWASHYITTHKCNATGIEAISYSASNDIYIDIEYTENIKRFIIGKVDGVDCLLRPVKGSYIITLKRNIINAIHIFDKED